VLASGRLGPDTLAGIVAILEQQLAALEASRGAQHPALAEPLYQIAQAYDVIGQGARAEPFLGRACALAENTLRKYSKQDLPLPCLTAKAIHYYLQKQPAKVEELYKESERLSRPTDMPEPLNIAFLRAYSIKLDDLGFEEESECVGARMDEAASRWARDQGLLPRR
jgi:hypothetical protein